MHPFPMALIAYTCMLVYFTLSSAVPYENGRIWYKVEQVAKWQAMLTDESKEASLLLPQSVNAT